MLASRTGEFFVYAWGEGIRGRPEGKPPGGPPGMPGNGGNPPAAPPPGKGKGGGWKPWCAPGWFCGSMGLAWAWPSAA